MGKLWELTFYERFELFTFEIIKSFLLTSTKWVNKAQLNNVRVFVSGTNLLTWTSYKYADPEMPVNGIPTLGLPNLKTVTFGVELGI